MKANKSNLLESRVGCLKEVEKYSIIQVKKTIDEKAGSNGWPKTQMYLLDYRTVLLYTITK